MVRDKILDPLVNICFVSGTVIFRVFFVFYVTDHHESRYFLVFRSILFSLATPLLRTLRKRNLDHVDITTESKTGDYFGREGTLA